MAALDETHDPARRSWVQSANSGSDFPIQNLPFGIFHRPGEPARGGVAIGDVIFDLGAGVDAGLFSGGALEAAKAARGSTLNPLMAMGRPASTALRARLSDLLRDDGPEAGRLQGMAHTLLVPMAEAVMQLPVDIGDFTDFYTSKSHGERAGRLRNPDNPLPPCFKYLPVAYHSRSSSIRASGQPLRRPHGQWRQKDGQIGVGPVDSMDFELEFGFFVGAGSALGETVPLAQARDHIFGYCLVNDWSVRLVQLWESVVGPFLAKNLLTTISPWVVTEEALAPYRVPAPQREPGDPQPFPYLDDAGDRAEGALDVQLTALILTERMRREGAPPVQVSATNFRQMYWTFGQMLAHHASNGCNLRPGDLVASGTTSGPTDDARGCMLELTSIGTQPIDLGNGEQRTWLEDGDEVIFRASAGGSGGVRIGFGECRGRIEPAR